MNLSELIQFLTQKMSMTEVYQPVIVKELLLNGGECTKDELASKLAEYDLSVREYYRKIVMRWPKITLSKHHIIRYERKGERFILECDLVGNDDVDKAIKICDSKIAEWIEKKRDREKSPVANDSVRYRVLKRAKGKCELCGIPSGLRPIDIDHIIPQSTADKNGKVLMNGQRINVHSECNLQALCFKCNRAKRAADDTDFRRTQKLVRDRIPEIIKQSGRDPILRKVTDKRLVAALNEKLIEEHEEYIDSRNVEELADMVEVIINLARLKGVSQEQLLNIVEIKRKERGSFEKGYFYEGNI